jgi:PBP1b-binding outer membrane lipoprotein LpoB
MWEYINQIKNKIIFCVFLSAVFITSCKKEENKKYIYDVNNVKVTQDGVAKPNVKSNTEFISIAYSDLFGSTIDQAKLTELSTAYEAFGDKKIIEDLIIRNFLNSQSVSIPTVATMNANVSLFVTNTYKKFYNRVPNEFELWQMTTLIQNDANTTPELVYYSFMTSNEYRYY